MPRTHTPDRVNTNGSKTIKMQRACNGCGQILGDVTDEEMQAGINGRPLPDVRQECPTCGPTAPPPACLPTAIIGGDWLCIERECDHEIADGADYCDEVREETVCATHSTFTQDPDTGHEVVDHAEPWPCTRSGAAAPEDGTAR